MKVAGGSGGVLRTVGAKVTGVAEELVGVWGAEAAGALLVAMGTAKGCVVVVVAALGSVAKSCLRAEEGVWVWACGAEVDEGVGAVESGVLVGGAGVELVEGVVVEEEWAALVLVVLDAGDVRCSGWALPAAGEGRGADALLPLLPPAPPPLCLGELLALPGLMGRTGNGPQVLGEGVNVPPNCAMGSRGCRICCMASSASCGWV